MKFSLSVQMERFDPAQDVPFDFTRRSPAMFITDVMPHFENQT